MRVEIWSDLICPWCYIGKRRFEKALAAFDHRDEVEVVHRSFQLDPSTPRGEAHDLAEMLAAKFGMPRERAVSMNREMEARAAEDGLTYNLVGGSVGNTADAHRLLHLAEAKNIQPQVLEAFYKAYFTDQKSLFDRDSLLAVATEAGLPAEETARVLDSDEYADAVVSDQQAAQQMGATGVPFFVLDNRYGVSGAQPTELFAQALTQAWNESRPVLLEGPGETCTDDTCAVPESKTGA
ncbi:DsbA family oxidoreductase [Actinomadura hibisca]|uniref:DsbA family oxidoreductase n=1 Tax=Actinomadura hibisca TaxID=68565 RepID=UPI0008355C11|nr:DsbA family oxidoreductase [Actinomadura hibisca]